MAWYGAHAVTKTRSPSTSGRSHLTWSATASQTSSGMWSVFVTCVLRCTNDTVFARQSMSDSLRALMSPARMPRTDASSIIARSRLGRSERGKLSNIVDTSAAGYADGTVECLWPGIWGTAAATSGPHAPTLARKRVKSRATQGLAERVCGAQCETASAKTPTGRASSCSGRVAPQPSQKSRAPQR